MVELADLRMVALEQLEEARLRSGGPLHAPHGKVRQTEIEIREVEHEILHPQRRALADRRELRGLKMRVAERRFVLPPDCERSESPQDGNQARAKQSQ